MVFIHAQMMFFSQNTDDSIISDDSQQEINCVLLTCLILIHNFKFFLGCEFNGVLKMLFVDGCRIGPLKPNIILHYNDELASIHAA